MIKEFLDASKSGHVLLLYYGLLNKEVKEHLLATLKYNLSNYGVVPVRYRKRAFSIADECITNIFQYYRSSGLPLATAGISVVETKTGKLNTLDFIFTNIVKAEDRNKLEEYLKTVYNRPPEKVRDSFINRISEKEQEDNAGLGLIIVSQRALGNFDYSFEVQKDESYLFHLKISLDIA